MNIEHSNIQHISAAEKSCLAATGRPEQGEELAALNGDIDLGQRVAVTEALHEILHFNCGRVLMSSHRL